MEWNKVTTRNIAEDEKEYFNGGIEFVWDGKTPEIDWLQPRRGQGLTARRNLYAHNVPLCRAGVATLLACTGIIRAAPPRDRTQTRRQ